MNRSRARRADWYCPGCPRRPIGLRDEPCPHCCGWTTAPLAAERSAQPRRPLVAFRRPPGRFSGV